MMVYSGLGRVGLAASLLIAVLFAARAQAVEVEVTMPEMVVQGQETEITVGIVNPTSDIIAITPPSDTSFGWSEPRAAGKQTFSINFERTVTFNYRFTVEIPGHLR